MGREKQDSNQCYQKQRRKKKRAEESKIYSTKQCLNVKDRLLHLFPSEGGSVCNGRQIGPTKHRPLLFCREDAEDASNYICPSRVWESLFWGVKGCKALPWEKAVSGPGQSWRKLERSISQSYGIQPHSLWL